MKSTALLSVVVLSSLLAGVVGFSLRTPSTPPTSGTSSRFEQILRSNTIRVGYVNVPASFNVDPNTKEKSGVFFDVLETIAKNTGFKIDYVEEVNWGSMIAGLQTGRYDMVASPAWASANRARQALFSNPVYFSAIGVWVRADETRFSAEPSWSSLNNPDVRIGALDNSTGVRIAQSQLPQANLVTYPVFSSESEIFLDLTHHKIDVFFEEPAKGLLFAHGHPGTIKDIAKDKPIRVFPDVFLLPEGETRLKQVIDAALEELHNSGFIEQVLKKYEPLPGAYRRVASPYQ